MQEAFEYGDQLNDDASLAFGRYEEGFTTENTENKEFDEMQAGF